MAANGVKSFPKKMRIFALPLTRARPDKPAYVYYLTHLPPKEAPSGQQDQWMVSKGKQAVKKLTDTWNGWESKPDRTWQKRLHNFGMRAQSRIDFEELALGSIDPALGPSIMPKSLVKEDTSSDTPQSSLSTPSVMTLYHPKSFLSIVGRSPLSDLTAHLAHRSPKHKSRFYTYVIIIPFTIPFAIIPVIPNIPFFFCAWRAWSNWRAYRAADYLKKLIEVDAIQPEADEALDASYTIADRDDGSHPTAQSGSQDSQAEGDRSSNTILDRESVKSIVRHFEIPPEREAEIVRGIDQARFRSESVDPKKET